MTIALDVSRRKFLAGSAAAATGLSLGFHIPFAGEAAAQGAAIGARAPEVNAWVVIRPDDTIVVRIARSEMARGPSPALPNSSSKSSRATGRR
jgi:isoquinoline 1-oxidoreductase beta subunit